MIKIHEVVFTQTQIDPRTVELTAEQAYSVAFNAVTPGIEVAKQYAKREIWNNAYGDLVKAFDELSYGLHFNPHVPRETIEKAQAFRAMLRMPEQP